MKAASEFEQGPACDSSCRNIHVQIIPFKNSPEGTTRQSRLFVACMKVSLKTMHKSIMRRGRGGRGEDGKKHSLTNACGRRRQQTRLPFPLEAEGLQATVVLFSSKRPWRKCTTRKSTYITCHLPFRRGQKTRRPTWLNSSIFRASL